MHKIEYTVHSYDRKKIFMFIVTRNANFIKWEGI
jgi:hypothetical protein